MIAYTHTAASDFRHSRLELPPESVLFGRTDAMHSLRARLDKAVTLDVPVLVEGESGTGKDVLARMLHARSPWNSGIFVKVTCSSISDTLADCLGSAATGDLSAYASADCPRHPCYGTLFLDGITDSSCALQSRLSRLLQEGQFCSVNLQQHKLNLRLVCATNSGWEKAPTLGSFRRELLPRIKVLTLRMPPLRERMVDIPDLTNYFVERFSEFYHCSPKPLSREVLHSLLSYSWPGNVRELENLMRRYVLFGCEESLCEELTIRSHKCAFLAQSESGAVSLKELTRNAVREVERDAILKVLEANRWNRRRAAIALKISYRALLYKLKAAGMSPNRVTTDGLATESVQRAAH